jgi:hypothetical protein
VTRATYRCNRCGSRYDRTDCGPESYCIWGGCNGTAVRESATPTPAVEADPSKPPPVGPERDAHPTGADVSGRVALAAWAALVLAGCGIVYPERTDDVSGRMLDWRKGVVRAYQEDSPRKEWWRCAPGSHAEWRIGSFRDDLRCVRDAPAPEERP